MTGPNTDRSAHGALYKPKAIAIQKVEEEGASDVRHSLTPAPSEKTIQSLTHGGDATRKASRLYFQTSFRVGTKLIVIGAPATGTQQAS